MDGAPLDDPRAIADALLAALGIHGARDRPPLERLCLALAPKDLLLVLDNCEHLGAHCGHVAQALLLADLDRRFDILADPSGATPRHQSLRTVIDWSYAALSTREQQVFLRLADLADGWSLAAAEAHCAGIAAGAELLAISSSLVEKSLLILAESAGPARYRMLATLRAYARERWRQSGAPGGGAA